jgi:hypothetical protein
MSNNKKQLVALAKEYIKTPRGAFIAGVLLGAFIGKQVLGWVF